MKPEPVFEQPWHAQVFALTVHLNESGRLDWSDWAARFGAMLKKHGVAKELNGGEDYFAAWLETLESVLAEEGAASFEEASEMRGAWERAYLETPHGEPVKLRS